jgi:hypothetical protein
VANKDFSRRLLREHKRWADGHALAYIIFAVFLFGGFYGMLGSFGMPSDERLTALLLLSVIVILHAIWLAAGIAVARIHEIVANAGLRADER